VSHAQARDRPEALEVRVAPASARSAGSTRGSNRGMTSPAGGLQFEGLAPGAEPRRSASHQAREQRPPGGGFKPGERVVLNGLESAKGLNGEEGVLVSCDPDGGRWVVRLSAGDEFRARPVNLISLESPSRRTSGAPAEQQVQSSASDASTASPSRPKSYVVQNKPSYQRATTVTVSNDPLRGPSPVPAGATRPRKETVPSAQDAGTELEGLLLQTNWSAIYQLFHQRFGIATMDRLERGFVVKGAVEMTLSIVAKCFALLRSDPNGKLHCTPLHIAALQSSTEAAEVIVRDLPKLVEQTHKPSRTALTPLHIAVLCGGQAIAELLLEAHADPNVRTLHDVCPIHLASTTSKEMVQLLLAFGADSTKKDVMGSTAMHYATCFRQHPVTEALLAFNTSAERLPPATESDQKRVSPLHISCALYATEDDMLSPLHLLANGAKPYQTDVSGAAAREVVRGGRGSALQQFFERVGDRPREAALQFLEDRFFTAQKQSADDAVGEGGGGGIPVSSPPSIRSSRPNDEAAQAAGGAGLLRFPQRSAAQAAEETKKQLTQLQQELEQQQQKFGLELDQLQMELDHARQKITQLELADANQKKMNSDWQALLDSAQKSHQAQLEEVRKRHVDDRALWEENSKAEVERATNEAVQRAARQHDAVRRELEARLQEADSKLHGAEEERKLDVQQLQDALGVAEQELRDNGVALQKARSQLEERNHNLRQRDLDLQLLKAQLEDRNHNIRQRDLDLQLSKAQVKELRQKDLELQQAKSQLEDLRQKDLELQHAKSQLEDLRQKDLDHQQAKLQLEELRQKDIDHEQAKAQLEAQAAKLEAAVRDLEGSRQQLEQQAAGEQQQAQAQLEDLRKKDLDLQQAKAQLEDLRRKDLEHEQAKKQLEDLRQKDLEHQSAKAALEASLMELEKQQHQLLVQQQPVEQQLVQSAPVAQQMQMQQPMQMQQVQQQEPVAVVAAPVLQSVGIGVQDQGLRDAVLMLYSQYGIQQPANTEATSDLLEPIVERLAQMQGAPLLMDRTLSAVSEVEQSALASRIAELEAEVEGHMKRNSELNEAIQTEKDRAAQLAKESRTKAGEDKELEKVEGRLAKEKEARRVAEERARELERATEEKAAAEQALQEQLRRLQEEVPSLRSAREEAEDRATQLELQVKEAQNSSAGKVLELQSEIQRLELESTQEVAKLKAKVESATKRAEAAEEKVKQAQPMIDEITQKWLDEQTLRKKLHNQLQDMKGAIRVYCRFRPMVKRELEKGDVAVLTKKDSMNVEINRPAPLNDSKLFQFEAVFDGDSTQEQVFSDCRDLIQSAIDGYNVTVFAYGQTGAGKTHTMYGNPDQPGLAPRTIEALFDMVRKQERGGGKKFVVKFYMIEVYKQDIIDLLGDPSKQKKSLEVKKDVGRGIMYVDGVTEHEVNSPAELEALMADGEKKRHTSATKMNSASSRSHLLLSIIVEGKVQETQAVIYGKVTLCDLAGSERPKKSEVVGDGLKEAIEINKSLSALGDVVEALCKGSKTVPYRNHKLTMLMQDSLGGSAKTLMFVNCSPASSNAEETMMSLTWANRARKVTNDVKKNVDTKEVARLKQVIKMMSVAQTVEEGGKSTIEDSSQANDLSATMAATAAGGWLPEDQ